MNAHNIQFHDQIGKFPFNTHFLELSDEFCNFMIKQENFPFSLIFVFLSYQTNIVIS